MNIDVSFQCLFLCFAHTIRVTPQDTPNNARTTVKPKTNKQFFWHSQSLFVAGQTPISCHLTLTHLLATYENYSCKEPAPVMDTFFVSWGCPFTRASAVSWTIMRPHPPVKFLWVPGKTETIVTWTVVCSTHEIQIPSNNNNNMLVLKHKL